MRAVNAKPLVHRGSALDGLWFRLKAGGHDCLNDAGAGLVASVIPIANIVSFGALLFPGDLSAGIPTAIWAMLIGGGIGGVWIALVTSLPPLAAGMELANGGRSHVVERRHRVQRWGRRWQPADRDSRTAMLAFTAATLISGTLFFAVGVCRWGSYFRFVPYCVVGGFLAAAGWLLLQAVFG